jgi:hypothetical protein
MKRKRKQSGTAIPPTKRIITFHLDSLNTKRGTMAYGGEFKSWRGTDMWRRIQVLVWNRHVEENSSPGVEQTCGGEFKSWRGTDMWRRIQVLAWNRHVEENSSPGVEQTCNGVTLTI